VTGSVVSHRKVHLCVETHGDEKIAVVSCRGSIFASVDGVSPMELVEVEV
jgi:hypothetical protein